MVTEEELIETGHRKVEGGYWMGDSTPAGPNTLLLLVEGKMVPASTINPTMHHIYGADRDVFDEWNVRPKEEEPTVKFEMVPTEAPPLSKETMETALKSRVGLEIIGEISKDGMGLGVLYDDLGPPIGLEPKANLVRLLASNSGLDIRTEVISTELVELEVDGKKRKVWRSHARATDKFNRSAEATVWEPADQTVAFIKGEQYTKRDGKKVDVTRLNEPKAAGTKAVRNAEAKLLGYPKQILVPLIQKVMERYKKQKA